MPESLTPESLTPGSLMLAHMAEDMSVQNHRHSMSAGPQNTTGRSQQRVLLQKASIALQKYEQPKARHCHLEEMQHDRRQTSSRVNSHQCKYIVVRQTIQRYAIEPELVFPLVTSHVACEMIIAKRVDTDSARSCHFFIPTTTMQECFSRLILNFSSTVTNLLAERPVDNHSMAQGQSIVQHGNRIWGKRNRIPQLVQSP